MSKATGSDSQIQINYMCDVYVRQSDLQSRFPSYLSVVFSGQKFTNCCVVDYYQRIQKSYIEVILVMQHIFLFHCL